MTNNTKTQLNGWTRTLIQVITISAAAAVVYGGLQQKVTTNETILHELKANKLDREIYAMHAAQQKETFEKIEKALDSLDAKMDTVIMRSE